MGTAVQTNGIGRSTDAHMNLTRSLADVWRLSHGEVAKVRRKLHGGPSLPLGPVSTMASVSPPRPKPRPSGKILVKRRDGSYLHMSGTTFTLVKADAWRGTADQLDALKAKVPEAAKLVASL